MELTQLVYVSELSNSCSAETLGEIIEHSSIKNARRNISGVLLCQGVHLMQLLEGDRAVVRDLFTKIQADNRHSNVTPLLEKRVGRRLYPEWGMGLVDPTSRALLNRDRLVRLLTDVRAANNTRNLGVEARVLLQDFAQQLVLAA